MICARKIATGILSEKVKGIFLAQYFRLEGTKYTRVHIGHRYLAASGTYAVINMNQLGLPNTTLPVAYPASPEPGYFYIVYDTVIVTMSVADRCVAVFFFSDLIL